MCISWLCKVWCGVFFIFGFLCIDVVVDVVYCVDDEVVVV